MKYARDIVLLFTCLIQASVLLAQHPYDWKKYGTDPQGYEIGEDEAAAREHPGRWPAAAYLMAVKPESGRFGTLIQAIEADDYLGTRVRLSAWIKTKDVTGWAGMWMRVDGANRVPLNFDNMCHRPILGTTDWLQYSIVLNVPRDAKQIYYGLLLAPLGPNSRKDAERTAGMSGGAIVWLKDVQFEVVDKKAKTTDTFNCPSWAR